MNTWLQLIIGTWIAVDMQSQALFCIFRERCIRNIPLTCKRHMSNQYQLIDHISPPVNHAAAAAMVSKFDLMIMNALMGHPPVNVSSSFFSCYGTIHFACSSCYGTTQIIIHSPCNVHERPTCVHSLSMHCHFFSLRVLSRPMLVFSHHADWQISSFRASCPLGARGPAHQLTACPPASTQQISVPISSFSSTPRLRCQTVTNAA